MPRRGSTIPTLEVLVPESPAERLTRCALCHRYCCVLEPFDVHGETMQVCVDIDECVLVATARANSQLLLAERRVEWLQLKLFEEA